MDYSVNNTPEKKAPSWNSSAWKALGLTAMPWLVFLLEHLQDKEWFSYGLYPRTISGLKGIFTMPFLHADLAHIASNSVSLLVLLTLFFYFFRKVAPMVLLGIYLLSGLFTWCVAHPGYHIGASAVIYGLAGYLFCIGLFKRYRPLQALSLLVIFLYGGLVWGLFPLQPDVSWEGHLSGLVSGIVLAWRYRNEPYSFEPEPEPEDNEPDDENPYWLHTNSTADMAPKEGEQPDRPE